MEEILQVIVEQLNVVVQAARRIITKTLSFCQRCSCFSIVNIIDTEDFVHATALVSLCHFQADRALGHELRPLNLRKWKSPNDFRKCRSPLFAAEPVVVFS